MPAIRGSLRCVRSFVVSLVRRACLCSASGDSLSLSSLRRDEQTREQNRKEHNTGSQETRSPGACVGTSSCVRSAPRPVLWSRERQTGRQWTIAIPDRITLVPDAAATPGSTSANSCKSGVAASVAPIANLSSPVSDAGIPSGSIMQKRITGSASEPPVTTPLLPVRASEKLTSPW